MSTKISHVIESKLRFLKLTRSGKIRLNMFNDKTLYKALSQMQRSFTGPIPDHPYKTYFAYCILESQRLKEPVNAEIISEFPNFDEAGDVTLDEEQFDAKKVNNIMNDLKGKSYFQKQSYDTSHKAHNKDGGPTFDKGVTYWKYGKECKYPDQFISQKETNPCKSDPNFRPNLGGDSDERLNLEPIKELTKAIRSGNVNREGLAFLRDAYIKHKPELIPIIDEFLNDPNAKCAENPNGTQKDMFEEGRNEKKL